MNSDRHDENTAGGGRPRFLRLSLGRALVLLVLASAVTLWVWLVPTPRQSITTSTGAKLEFLGVAVGTNHYLTDPWWARTARRVLPAKVTRWVPPPPPTPPHDMLAQLPIFHPMARVMDPTSLTLYFQAAFAPHTLSVIDQDGFAFPRPRRTGGSWAAGQLRWETLDCYPRRQRQFTVRAHGRSALSVAEFQVRNPLTGKFPEWAPEALPVTHTNGLIALRLSDVRLRKDEHGLWVEPDWRLVVLDPSWTGAEMPEFWVEDATGNRTPGGALSPREKTWKLRTLVRRNRLDDFAPREALTFAEVPLPGRTDFVPLVANVTLDGVELAVWGLSGGELRLTNGIIPGRTDPANSPPRKPIAGNHHWLRLRFRGASEGTNMLETWTGESPFLLLEADGLEPEDRLHCFVQSSPSARPGQPIPQLLRLVIASDEGRRIFQWPIPEEQASPVTLTLAVDRPRAFEFLVAPPPYPPVPNSHSGARSP